MQLDAVLKGHEDRVHSVRWGGGRGWVESEELVVVSASMDKTMQVWRPDANDGVWTAAVRVGDIGGQPGQLGYYGALLFPLRPAAAAAGEGKHRKRANLRSGGVGLLAHGHNGAFFAWRPATSASTNGGAEAEVDEGMAEEAEEAEAGSALDATWHAQVHESERRESGRRGKDHPLGVKD